MCRHLAYLGPPRTLASLLHEPRWSLERQAWAPRMQPDGARLNGDGWGVGWWDHDRRPEPARYRSATPMWADQALRSVAEVVEAGAVVAAVRAATPPSPVVETGNAPFAAGPWLFSLNGRITGFGGEVGVDLRRAASPGRAAGILGSTDSEVLFALVLDRLDAGCPPAEAVAEVVRRALDVAPGRLNLLLSDGRSGVATTWGSTLFTLHDTGLATGGVLVASEPLDDDPGWSPVPDGQLVTFDRAGTTTVPLDLPGAPA
ncbi:MAG: ergothioneine biosynthesis protein EgtC [Acidimicrobiia bacterium]